MMHQQYHPQRHGVNGQQHHQQQQHQSSSSPQSPKAGGSHPVAQQPIHPVTQTAKASHGCGSQMLSLAANAPAANATTTGMEAHHHHHHPVQPKATTDALAAAALCELFRGEGKELEQVSV